MSKLYQKALTRSDTSLSLDELLTWFNTQGIAYPYLQTTLGTSPTQEFGGTFNGLIDGAYKANSVVFACMDTRKRVFSEARLKFRRVTAGKPGDLFVTSELDRFETPWTNGSTGDLLSHAIADVDLAGNFYALRRPDGGIQRLRPDWVRIVLGSKDNPDLPSGSPDMELIGYYYTPSGVGAPTKAYAFQPEQVAHWAPIPDPNANYRGMSWLTPLIREIMADTSAMRHKLAFFDNGATPNLAIKMDPAVNKDAFDTWVQAFKDNHEGAANAYKTIFLGGGADAQMIGANLRQLDFAEVQGHGETRIAAAAGVPPIVVGLSEGLQAATYSNYAQARRAFADTTLRFLWRTFCEAMESITNVPPNAELWYDSDDIPFLREDGADLAGIQVAQAGAIKALTEAGYTPESCVKAIAAGDLTLLQHSGLTSVQLLPPGTQANNGAPPSPGPNGAAPAPAAAASLVDRVAEQLLLDADKSS